MKALPWIVAGAAGLLAYQMWAAKQVPAPVVQSGPAPSPGIRNLTEAPDGVRPNFQVRALARPTSAISYPAAKSVSASTVATRQAGDAFTHYDIFNAGEVASRPFVPDAIARSLQASPLGMDPEL